MCFDSAPLLNSRPTVKGESNTCRIAYPLTAYIPPNEGA